MDREHLLKDRVKDVRVDGETTLSDLMRQLGKSGGFSTGKIYTAHSILKRMFSEENTTFLSFPADIIATGTRGIITDMIRSGLIDVIITTCGTIDHDIARSLGAYYCGDFSMSDVMLREIGINRLGNVLVPDESYGPLIEHFTQPILENLYAEKKEWAPVDLIDRFGSQINDESSILFQAHRMKVPIFIPGITDGSFGSQLWSFYERHKDFSINLLEDEHRLSDIIFDSKKAGALMIGGGISKHHTIWWNQFRGGLDYAIYITTAQEYDGSLSGARLEEAISWGKVKPRAKFVNVYGDATVILPLLLAPFL
ncbi:MAG: deoxyhypusine synthase [Candidatus Thermoplasmatota archaeon]|nr:deoxyhypusine synthase [Candidatus Thermoplasmatota archaeon]MCL5731056.1 deoxyhypusine synthase [Candidatus Thermoplasmatota archaeon]